MRQTTGVNTRAVPANFVYQNPSISALAKYVSNLAGTGEVDGSAMDDKQRVAAMHEMAAMYSKDLPKHAPNMDRPVESIVLVTGTTGSMGAALLAALINDPKVAKVYAVNRKSGMSLAERQKQALADRGYDAERIVKSEKVVFVDTNMDSDRFGLQPDLYQEVNPTFAI